jgi:hypothetical protein
VTTLIAENEQKSTTNGAAPPPAGAALFQLITGAFATSVIHVIAKLRIPDLLENGARSSEELARLTETHPPSLYRVLRAAAALGALREDANKIFSLTPVGDLLRTNAPGSLRALAQFMGEGWHMQIYGELLHSVRTGKTVASRVLGQEIFSFFRDNPDQGATFNDAMTSLSSALAPAIVAAYDFSDIDSLVDVGGGHGLLLASILKANPQMHGTLFDLPHVLDGARALLQREGVAERAETASGNFFEAVPEGADAYIMQHIIHDWADDEAETILRNCHRAMRAKGKVLLAEAVIPPHNEFSFGKLSDLEMMLLPGGRERTEEEFRALLGRAGFEMTRIIPTGSPECIIEGVKI